MTPYDLVLRLLQTPPALLGGPIAQHVLIAVAARWTFPDGACALFPARIRTATGLSEATVTRALRELKSANLFRKVNEDEWRIDLDHLPLPERHGAPTECQGALATSNGDTGSALPQSATALSDGGNTVGASPPAKSATALRQSARAIPQSAGRPTGPEAVHRAVSRTTSSPPSSSSLDLKKEEEDSNARAGEAPSPEVGGALIDEHGNPFSDGEAKTLAWVNRAALPWTLANGADLRREWLDTLRHLRPSEADQVRKRMAGDTPAAFRKAMGTELTAARQKRAEDAIAGAQPPPAPRETAEEASACIIAERDQAAERARLARADEEQRERGTYREQAITLLGEIDAIDDTRKIALANEVAAGWTSAVQRLRTTIADHGRAKALDLALVRSGWPRVRDRQLPALPVQPPAERSFSEPATDDEPAATPTDAEAADAS